jgi:hypothetical protein
MKSIYALLLVTFVSANVFAQDEKSGDEEVKKGGFRKENLFAGGTVNAGFGSGTTSLGLGPFFGYSINKYLDVAVSFNYSYTSQRDYYSSAKYRQSIIGPGAFVRIFPVKFLFAQAQYERNFIQQKIIYGGSVPNDKFKVNSSSFLVGPGFASGRDQYNKTFFYLSVLWDLKKDQYSPYLDNQGRVNPVFRAGVNVSLFQPNEARGVGVKRRDRESRF